MKPEGMLGLKSKTGRMIPRSRQDEPARFGSDSNKRLGRNAKRKTKLRKAPRRFATNVKPYNAGGLGAGGWSIF